MKTYNRALDFMALAAVQFTKGRVQTAAKLIAKATTSADFQQAIAIIEASNSQAFTAKEAEKAKLAAAASKKRKVKAAEDQALESLVGPIDELEDDMDVVDDEVDEAAEDEEEGDEVDAEFGEDEGDDEEEDASESFAKALASLKKPAAKSKK